MPTISEFCELLQERLGLDVSYTATDLPGAVNRYVRGLLRNYHFPKSVRVHMWTHPAEGSQAYDLPADFKKDLQTLWMDDSDPAVPSYGQPLRKWESFVPLDSDRIPRRYWLQGTKLWTDLVMPSDSPNSNLIMVYESNDPAYSLTWMLEDLEDVLFSLSMARLSAELNKPELAQVWLPLWKDDEKALAIYVNELEYANLDMQMRQTDNVAYSERYPSTLP